ncbi:MAG: hypothetical protein BWK75_02705 [Candidatus Altiarchaeales archaeon A3]|nr:MAG: hypothetical protein BWK75_02705 [Candidatus Altiarchaeales archaeon A3]
MKIFLKDTPGSLIKAIEPVSANGGNIESIVHGHQFKENDEIPVEIVFGIEDVKSLENIKSLLLNEGIKISDINIEGKKYYKKRARNVILVGHIIDKNIMDTLDRINEEGLVSDLSVIMKSPESVSACMLKIECDEAHNEQVNKKLNEICNEKNFLLISDLD